MESPAERLLTDPAFTSAVEALKSDLVRQLEDAEIDGSRESKERVLELVRLLQVGRQYQRLLWAQVDRNKLTSHEAERRARYRQAGL